MTTANEKAANRLLMKYNHRQMKLRETPTRRQQKHDLLLTFMANQPSRRQTAGRTRSSLLRSILSIFL